MKAHLLYRDLDFSEKEPMPSNAEQLEHDLDLATLYKAMAAGDERSVQRLPGGPYEWPQ